MNKTVVITGASGDIGLAIAEAFYKENYNLVLMYNSNKKSISDFIEKHKDGFILPVKADLKKKSEIDSAIDNIKNNVENIDVLINNAGISLIEFFDSTTEEQWDEIFDVNVKGAFLVTKNIVPSMINNKRGCIINMSSMWGVNGASMEVAYSATKAAIIGMSTALSKELGPSGINVNVIAPGYIDTKMNSHVSDEDKAKFADQTPLGRIGSANDVAGICTFLASDKAKFITGQVINVDGGYL